MKKVWAVTLVLALALCLFAGCEQDSGGDSHLYSESSHKTGQTSENNVVVNFFGYKADAMNLTAIERAIHGFMEEYPGIEIVYEGIKGTAYTEAFMLRAENNTLDDMFMILHDQFMLMLAQDRLVDLTDVVDLESFSDMTKSQFVEKDGSIYTVPIELTCFGLYVNLDMLQENGFEPPTNWAEFSQQCDYFKSQGITPIIGNNYTTLYTLMSARSLAPIYRMADNDEIIDAFNAGEADIMEYLVDGVEMVGTMLERGWFDRDELRNVNQTSDDLALFAQGDRPFMITGGWASPRLMALEPKCSYAIYPYPVLDDGSILVINITTCLSVNRDSEHIAEAKSFVKYLTQPDVVYEYCDAHCSFSPLNDDRLPSDKTVLPAVEALRNEELVIGSDFRLTLPIDNVDKTVGEAMRDGMSTEDAIKLLAELLKQ